MRTTPNDEGFTLIELLVVMVIIGILAAIAVPIFLSQRRAGYDTKAKADLRQLATMEELHLTDVGSYGQISELRAANEQVLVSSGVTLTVEYYTATSGFCLSAKHLSSSNTWYYDSRNYGIQARGSTGCGVTTAGQTGDAISG